MSLRHRNLEPLGSWQAIISIAISAELPVLRLFWPFLQILYWHVLKMLNQSKIVWFFYMYVLTWHSKCYYIYLYEAVSHVTSC